MKKLRWILLAVALVVVAALAVVLILRSGGARIHGTVTLPSGEPAVRYTVIAELHPRGGSGVVWGIPVVYPHRWVTTTDDEGNYLLTGVRTDQDVWVTVIVPGHGAMSYDCLDDLEPGGEVRVDLFVPEIRKAPR